MRLVSLLALASLARCVAQDVPRSIVNTAFAEQRVEKRVTPASASQSRPVSYLGVTLWRIRPSVAADPSGARLLIHKNEGVEHGTPVRIDSTTPLRAGDHVRISVESTRRGYLYIFDRERDSAGKLGMPYLIFPTARLRHGDNRVYPGKLVDLPGWDDTPNYWTLEPQTDQHAGEEITILITPKPLAEIVSGEEPRAVDPEQLAGWTRKWQSRTSILEAPETLNRPATVRERQAAEGTAKLNRQDPLPQTIYRIESKPDEAVLVSIPLRLRT